MASILMKKILVKNPKCATKVTDTKSTTNTRNGCVRCGSARLKDMKSVVKKHDNNKILFVTIPVFWGCLGPWLHSGLF